QMETRHAPHAPVALGHQRPAGRRTARAPGRTPRRAPGHQAWRPTLARSQRLAPAPAQKIRRSLCVNQAAGPTRLQLGKRVPVESAARDGRLEATLNAKLGTLNSAKPSERPDYAWANEFLLKAKKEMARPNSMG